MVIAQRPIEASPTRSHPNRIIQPATRTHQGGVLVFGMYFLLAAAALLEQYYASQPFPDDLGQSFPFFQDVATWTHIKGLSFSLAEIFMLGLLALVLFAGLSDRAFRFDRGSLMRPLGLYMGMVLVGEMYGLASGGNLTLSLWELRPQIYMLIAYVLACNLVKTRQQLNVLVWILVVAATVKGVQGLIRYEIELHGNLHSVESLFPHEQSFFFNLFLSLAPILFLYGGSRRLKVFVLLLLPVVLIADLANQRRAAVLGLVVGLAALLLVTAVLRPASRRAVIIIAITLAALWPPYYAAFKNSGGILGEVAHAVASSSKPDQRDLNSNLYRIAEDADIMATMRSSSTSMVIGYGFGKHMLVPHPLPGISTVSGVYVFWDIMPHNSILWVWMRMGTIGYLLLWLLIGTAIIQALRVARSLKDPQLQGVSVWIALVVMQQIIFGYLDLQWVSYRNMITLGVLFALISRLALLARDEEGVRMRRVTTPSPSHAWPRQPGMARTLAVVNGRLSRHASRGQVR